MGRSGKSGLCSNQRCWALNCDSNSISTPQYRFHRFPADEGNCLAWVIRSGNSLLLLNTHKQLKSIRALCSKHFTRDQFMVAGNVLSSLISNALPSIFTEPSIPRDKIPSTFLASPDSENIPPVKVPVVPVRLAVPVSHCSVEKPPSVPEAKRAVASSTPVDLLCGESSSSSLELSVHSSHASTSTPVSPNPSFKRKVLCDLSSNSDSVSKRRCIEVPASTPLISKQPTCRLLFSEDSGLSSSTSTPSESSSQTPAPLKRVPRKPVARKSTSTKYRTVLGSYNVSKSDLTPRKKAMVDDTRALRRQIYFLRRQLEAVKGNNKALSKVSNSVLVSKLKARMKTKEGALLMEAQLANHGRHKNAYRWTLPQKTLALALWKSSRKNYGFLRKILNLPCKSTLHALMARLKFNVGSNVEFFDHLKEMVKKFIPRDKACIVLWDEVHLAKSVNYSEAQDKIIGLEDHGNGSVKNRVADKALVFMVQSLTKKWKQPVAYYFSDGDVPGEVLVDLVKCVIAALQGVGFDIRASVSDQGQNNKSAVRILREATPNQPKKTKPRLCAACQKKRLVISKARKLGTQLKGDDRFFSKRTCSECRSYSIRPATHTYYLVGGKKVYHIWDVPHLLKMLRSNFQTYNVEFDDGKVAKWVHLEKLRDQDGIDGTFYSIALKLTERHLKACHNSDKMSVKMAAQILSHKVATALKKIHDWSGGKAIPGCLETSEFIHFCDKLFDSFNGSSPRGRGKALRVNLSDKSPHWEFWKEAEKKIKKWWFMGSKSVFSSHLGWLENITSVRELWQDLKDDYQLEYLNLRRLNQDALENLFSVIKSHGAKVPTAVQFIAGLKTAIITNLRNSGIRGANCEEDGGELLTDMNKLFEDASKKVSQGKPYEETALTDGRVEEEMTKADEEELLRLARSTVPQGDVNVKQESEVCESDDMFDALFGSVVCLAEGKDTVEKNVKKKKSRRKKIDPKQEELKEIERVKAEIEKENKGLLGNRRKMTAYVAGYVVKKCLERGADCEGCKECLVSDRPSEDHDLIVAFEYDEIQRLIYTTKYVIDTMVACIDIFLEMMHTSFHELNLMRIMKERIVRDVDVSSLGCSAHLEEMQRLFLLYFLRVSIYHRCRVMNREFAKSWKNKKTIASIKAQRKNYSVVKSQKIVKNKNEKQLEDKIDQLLEEEIDDPSLDEDEFREILSVVEEFDSPNVDDEVLCEVSSVVAMFESRDERNERMWNEVF